MSGPPRLAGAVMRRRWVPRCPVVTRELAPDMTPREQVRSAGSIRPIGPRGPGLEFAGLLASFVLCRRLQLSSWRKLRGRSGDSELLWVPSPTTARRCEGWRFEGDTRSPALIRPEQTFFRVNPERIVRFVERAHRAPPREGTERSLGRGQSVSTRVGAGQTTEEAAIERARDPHKGLDVRDGAAPALSPRGEGSPSPKRAAFHTSTWGMKGRAEHQTRVSVF